ncbi:oxidoreductase [Ornithinimicrobium ciconiae]|uniref:Oxidoreductase n=1 Tax=Ornithinimicrobium ciconiae TaxID=2594265 RepID=A0A516GC12_9MICO|nr:CE1759 family FMN reductase [Ornithinimicrobium ciconiae]QDO89017.1 oxidoreductase [Ornithinimicrobium ciconiae]
MARKLVVISAGLSVPSSTRMLADRISGSVQREVTARGESLEVEVVELRGLAREIADHLVSGMPPSALRQALAAVSSADAVVAVTPVFTASYSGLFKSFVDLLDNDALTGKPVLIAATAGTPRHSLVLDHALRPLFTYLRAVVVPTGVFAATEDFGGQGGGRDGEDGLDRRVARAASELGALLVATSGSVPGFTAPAVDEVGKVDRISEDSLTPFEQMLGSQLR